MANKAMKIQFHSWLKLANENNNEILFSTYQTEHAF